MKPQSKAPLKRTGGQSSTAREFTDHHAEPQRVSKRLYNLKEAAKYLGRSEWGMRELVYSGRIRFVKAPRDRRYFFDIADLDDFIESNKSRYG